VGPSRNCRSSTYRGADVNALRKNGATPLHAPTGKSMAELLIANGATVNAQDNTGLTPLHYAALAFAPIVLGTNPNLLLSKRTNLNVGDPSCQISLHSKKSVELAEVLLDNDAEAITSRLNWVRCLYISQSSSIIKKW